MRDLSEQYYCAGWLSDLEHDLWEIAVAPNIRKEFRFGQIEPKWRLALHQLADFCQGWWIHTDTGGNQFVALPEWKLIHRAWKKKQEK